MMIDWRPIGTAPKNPEGARCGAMVLLWDKYDARAVTGIWTIEKDFMGRVITGWWEVGMGGRGHLSLDSVTHWAPLTPPAEGEECDVRNV